MDSFDIFSNEAKNRFIIKGTILSTTFHYKMLQKHVGKLQKK